MKLGEFLASKWRYLIGATMLVLLACAATFMLYRPNSGEAENTTEPPAHVSVELQTKIDQWIRDNGLNRYGDKPGMHYAGGTPLFDEKTGARKNRYDYVLEHHPELSGKAAKQTGVK